MPAGRNAVAALLDLSRSPKRAFGREQSGLYLIEKLVGVHRRGESSQPSEPLILDAEFAGLDRLDREELDE
jgi:hypothetical protein